MIPYNIFTDDDLKRLKDGAFDPRLVQTIEQVQALIARLEAAEVYGSRAFKCAGCPKCTELEMAWRKACGCE